MTHPVLLKSVDAYRVLSLFTPLPFREIHLWDEPGGGVILPTPQPDLFFGLSPAQIEGSTAMNRICLKEARAQRQLHPWPSFQLIQVAFPFLIFKCRSDTGTLLFSENKAAVCAAKALAMLRGLDDEGSAGSSLSESIRDFPIIVFCSQAAMWEMLLAFRHTWQGQIDSTVSQMLKSPALVSFMLLMTQQCYFSILSEYG